MCSRQQLQQATTAKQMKFLTSTVAALGLAWALGDEHLRGSSASEEMSQKEFLDKNLFIYPETFGDYNLTACSSAPSCGTVMTTFNGVSARSNGPNQCTGNSCGGWGTYGYQYQCVELAQRYFGTLYGTAPVWYGNAIDLCNTYPSGVVKTSSPVSGDLVVFNSGTYGHVAVITSVTSSSVNVIEQNSSPNGVNTYSRGSNVACYLHATKNSNPSSVCPDGGWYCGSNGLGKDPNTNYYCSGPGGSISTSTACGMTCVSYPSGYSDTCTSKGSCAGLQGDYCGNDMVGGDANTLYHCSNGSPNGAKYCPNGCVVAASGYPDYCK
jgi:surface antigen